jgi:hypothetical protein
MTKELFIESIDIIKKQYLYDIECSELINKVYGNAFNANLLYDNHLLLNQLIKVLKDDIKDYSDTIEYFIYELEFGNKCKGDSITLKDGTKIDLHDAGKLYDYLISQKN